MTREFAWTFWTDVENWKLDADIESVELSGPFAEGSRGATTTRSAGRIEWRLAGVKAGSEAIIDVPLPGATGTFRWTFQDLNGRTRITQRVSIGVSSLAEMLAGGLERGIPAGMQKLCETMVKAAASER